MVVSKHKGNRFERFISDYLSMKFFGEKGHIWRNVSSGSIKEKGDFFEGDIVPVTSKAIKLRLFKDFVIEVKHNNLFKKVDIFKIFFIENSVYKEFENCKKKIIDKKRRLLFIFKSDNREPLVLTDNVIVDIIDLIEINVEGRLFYIYRMEDFFSDRKVLEFLGSTDNE